MKWIYFLLPLQLLGLAFRAEPYLVDTNLVLEEDVLGFNGNCPGFLIGVEEKQIFAPYMNAFFSVAKGRLFHYDEARAPFEQYTVEAQCGYSVPWNKRDVYRFTPFAGLGIYYQKLLNKDHTYSLYLPFGVGIDYHLGSYFTCSLVGSVLSQLNTKRETDVSGFFESIPTSLGCRIECPLSLALDPYSYVCLNVRPTYQYIAFGANPFAPLLETKTELQQFGVQAGIHAQF